MAIADVGSARPWRGWAWLAVGIGARGYLVFVAALAACALLPLLFGLTGSVVMSGSMKPLIQPGDVVLSQSLPADAPVPLGRVVSFPEAGRADGTVILHRIVGANPDGSLVTAGDANLDVDSNPLDRQDVLSTARLRVPWIGLPMLWFASGDFLPLSGWVAVTLLALLVEVRLGIAESRHRKGRGHRPVGRGPRRWHAPPVLAPGLLAAVMILVAPLAAILLHPVDASFSARTSSLGNSWTMAVAAPASKLAFTTQPSSSTGGIAFPTQPVVVVQNAAGGTTTGTRTVTIALTSAAGATLACAANTLTSTTGVIAFSGCAIDKAGTYTLTATSGTLTAAVSASVTITVGPAASLRFTTSPSGTTISSVFPTQPVVAVFDAGGNPRSSSAPIALALATPAGATLACATNPLNATGGVASFSGCKIDKAGTYALTASSSGLSSATSAQFVIAGSATPPLRCDSTIWMATFSWTPTPMVPTTYHLYVNGRSVPATGADGWNSYVQLTSNNVPASTFPQGTATVEVRKVLTNGDEQVIGTGTVVLGAAGYRTYTCG